MKNKHANYSAQLLKRHIYILLIPLLLLQSCTTTRITNNPADRDCPAGGKNLCHKQTNWVYFWGLVNDKEIVAKCGTGNITTVDIKNNYGYTAITFLTLGIVAPNKIEWNCGTVVPSIDTL